MILRKLLVILEISLQDLRCVQSVRTTGQTLAAVDAVLDLRHFCLSFRREELGVGRSSQKERHTGGIVDLNVHRAGHTVTAAAAEITG